MLLTRVLIGSFEHLLPIGVSLLFFFILIKYAKRASQKTQIKLIQFVSLAISASVICYHIVQIVNGNYNFKEDLPLYLCSFLGLVIPFFTYFRKYWMFEILVFWIIAGTFQGVITPDIAEGFPSLDYFRYWMVHLGLLGVMAYAIFIFKMKPKLVSVFKSYAFLQLYLLLMLLLNFMIGANYMYLNRKPDSASVLDMLGEWPIYALKADAILFIVFLVIYTCFNIIKGKKEELQ
jgi:hypothetical integral membrane protein (TIGR02206 family)